ncbi:MAG: hypothetical protein GY751_10685 [Bacteroidetes bacterium]|nr:hypothetical protein [Bacteroidota bacterium]
MSGTDRQETSYTRRFFEELTGLIRIKINEVDEVFLANTFEKQTNARP